MPEKNTLTRQVRRAYSQDTLARICLLPEHKFGRAFGMETVRLGSDRSEYSSWGPPADYYHFKDNGSRVLATAHLDTVVARDRRTPHFASTKYGPYIRSGALDDRLGAYVILKLLPALGITCDWLLTIGEESGQSTAGSFRPGKDYDWMIEFDRGGTDVVMYQYEDQASVRKVEACGADVGIGSYSDIAYLEAVGVKGFNWGVGYDGDYHSVKGYAYLADTFAMVAKYLTFHDQNAGTAMPHDPYCSSYGRPRGGYWWDEKDERFLPCEFCAGRACVDPDIGYCLDCGACWDCGDHIDDCMCYVPRNARKNAEDDDDNAPAASMTFTEYLAQRPGGVMISTNTTTTAAWPDQLSSWHETSQTGTIPAHEASPAGAQLGCLRCAARYPHEQLASLHPERACIGCDRCDAEHGAVRTMTGAIHVIPAHAPDDDADGCGRCLAARVARANQASSDRSELAGLTDRKLPGLASAG